MAEDSSGETSALSTGGGNGHVGGETGDRTDRRRKSDRQQSNDRSAWNWLLLPAIVIPLLVPLYNRVEPTLFGWPFFYWGQLAFIALGVATTSVVYQKTKTRKNPDARSRAGSGTAERTGR
ncbi:MAG: DUF3311 domain-containing protein [Geodermatophilaceae bacterium]|nr:DUF3311 domain-containing protein [Geodermatophilaceae bacterium]